MSFDNWTTEFANIASREKNFVEYHFSKLSPKESGDLYSFLLPQYIAYRSEQQTKHLVWATWALAISTIILSIITLFLK